MFGSRNRYASSLGSGVLVSADGYVVTNNHVLGEGNAEVTVALGDQRELQAQIVGVDSWTDLALLKVDATGPAGHPVGRFVEAEGRRMGDGRSATPFS